RSDIFACGIVLYELVTGRSLFGGLRGRQALDAIKTAQFVRPREVEPSLPEELEGIMLKALARRPDERYQTARELVYALGRFFFDLGAREETIFESGTLADFIARILPPAERARSGARPWVPAAAVAPLLIAPTIPPRDEEDDSRPL